MILCQPTGFFSWDYKLELDGGREGAFSLGVFGNSSSLYLPEGTYEVTKDGLFDPRWILSFKGDPVATAEKPNPLTRVFEITSDRLAFVLTPRHPLSRTFVIQVDGRAVGQISPAHAFTRRAQIDCTSQVPQPLQLFAFALAVLMWRRARNSS